MSDTVSVDADRLRADIETNSEFGAVDVAEGIGRTVLAGTTANKRARDYFVSQLREAGLSVSIDAVGNITGRFEPATADPDAAPVAAGSHLDSVPHGGIFDGPLGVYAAVEAVRAIQESDIEITRPIDVVCFTEEEGQRFSDGLLGSSVAVGDRSVDEALSLTSDSGVTLQEALTEIGYHGDGLIDPHSWDSWFELHIEQDTVLERKRIPVGVVTTITGITHCHVTIDGEANHAGATPMTERTDALTAAAEVILDVEECANTIVEESSESAVGTVGSLSVEPNATNVVPGRVTLGVDIRDVAYESMQTLVTATEDALTAIENTRGVQTAIDRPFDLEPTPMSDRLRQYVHDAGSTAGIATHDMHSGAAHDTMYIADVTDAVLLFAPSKNGISHNPREWTDWEDCAEATRVLAGAIARAAQE
ncbi:Zn-dependent hydrolase [Natronocalculus amylovorans]|uniref:Zn-dependent hydrolase n=1 Tax=Natronocalculus amylovorans TaxID=2917812 RepID=A0AAE3FYD1_9EURY|nr:Zn-dependent hydrolase [Natronocalculus amylovorans]MCL9816934.1 Zn-dependent hydrolase [Natronocalculus amylovorans]